jgi:hypothetical protein
MNGRSTAAFARGARHKARWTKIDAASMAIVDPVVADKLARPQPTKQNQTREE